MVDEDEGAYLEIEFVLEDEDAGGDLADEWESYLERVDGIVGWEVDVKEGGLAVVTDSTWQIDLDAARAVVRQWADARPQISTVNFGEE